MKKLFIYLSVLVFCFALGAIGLNLGYKYFTKSPETLPELGASAYSAARGEEAASVIPKRSGTGIENNSPAQEPEEMKITADTKMIYEYYYTLDNVSQRTEELAPYFMMGVTREKISELFTDWDVVSFSPEEVIMRKYINERSVQHYIVGVKDGYVAIFYEGGANGGSLKELTDKPVKTLTEADQKRLAEGIAIKGDDMLVKILEDYGS